MEGRSRKPMTSGVEIAHKLKGCNECNNPTKYVFGLWDGENGTHGAIYECNNLDCELKQNRLKAIDYSDENKKKVIAENESNMIFVDSIKEKRKELEITIRKMAMNINISCSEYSNYEQCREPFPIGMACRINTLFEIQKEGKE